MKILINQVLCSPRKKQRDHKTIQLLIFRVLRGKSSVWFPACGFMNAGSTFHQDQFIQQP